MVYQSALDGVFQALADPTRRAMLSSLTTGERTVSQLAEPFDMTLAAASKHIRTLERAGLLTRKVRGRTHVLSLEAAPMAEAQRWLRYYERFWTERIDALDRALRNDPSPGDPDNV
jgi:DNA-binding transcriptional ArsR family regulator